MAGSRAKQVLRGVEERSRWLAVQQIADCREIHSDPVFSAKFLNVLRGEFLWINVLHQVSHNMGERRLYPAVLLNRSFAP